MRIGGLALLALALAAARLQAQSEAQLKEYFEGKTVTLKLAMPGTEAGVDNGTAIRAGQTALVTKIRVKSKHIEFQLDGGGYGTMGDETCSSVGVESAAKSTRRRRRISASGGWRAGRASTSASGTSSRPTSLPPTGSRRHWPSS